jgi:uncharacterized protein (DUF1810 family)
MNNNAENLYRFIDAQEDVYHKVIQELRNGKKQSHWMWFIFPQIAGLGYSSTAKYYAIQNVDEARAYLAHPTVGARLLECTEIVVAHKDLSALTIFGDIDEMKLRSSMTLFAHIAGPESVYQQALDKYFDGEQDYRTLDILVNL